MGFSHIQISPIQNCYDYGEWHAKYQPLGYQIGNSYGNESDLKELISRVHRHQLKIIVDVVFNHLATVHYDGKPILATHWKSASLQPEAISKYYQAVYQSYSSVFPDCPPPLVPQIFQKWNEGGWIGGGLPQLNTLNPYVRKAHIAYLQHLAHLGVDGFRFDGIEHLGPDSLELYVQTIKNNSPQAYVYGEIVTTDPIKARQFGQILPITDYAFLEQLIQAFSFHGSLSTLLTSESSSPEPVSFSRSHDTWAAQQSNGLHGVYMVFPTEEDAELAAVLTLLSPNRIPMLLATDAKSRVLQNALKLRSHILSQHSPKMDLLNLESTFLQDQSQVLLVGHCDHEAVFIINKSNEEFSLCSEKISEVLRMSGNFTDLETGKNFLIESKKLGNSCHIFIPPRSAKFLLKSI
jgi:alpha-amylase